MAGSSPDDVVRERVRELLGDGPLSLKVVVDELDGAAALDHLREEGVPDGKLGEEVIDILGLAPGAWVTSGEPVLGLEDQLVDGLVLTHRLSAEEIGGGGIRVIPDLVVLDGSGHSTLELAGGGRLEQVPGEREPGEDHSTFQGPDGWLEGFAPGDLVAFRRQGDTVTVDRVDEDALNDDDHEVGLLRTAVVDRIRPGFGEEAYPIVFDVLARDPVAFRRPVRPLGEVLAAAGLSRRGFSFGRKHESWKAYHEWFQDGVRENIERRWGFDSCCRVDAQRVVEVLRTFDPEGEADFDARRIAEALGHGGVAPALVDLTLMDPLLGSDRQARFGAFARRIVDAVSPRRAASARLLWALGGEDEGSAEAEAQLQLAVRDDPDYGPAAAELARYAIVQGDLRRALTLLSHPDAHAGSGTIADVQALLTELEAPERGVGRNDPCPCGSGRKYKGCCQRNPRPPLARRLRLIRYKILRSIPRSCVADLAALAEKAVDPFIEDLAMFESDRIGDFVARWEEILPGDETVVIDELINLPLSVWQVEEVLPGPGLRLQEVAGRRVLDVVGPGTAHAVQAGDHLLARPIRLDRQDRLFGTTLAVQPDQLDDLIPLLEDGADAEELAEWYGETAETLFPRS